MNEVVNANELTALQRAVNQLPAKSRTALEMVHEGAGYEEVGVKLGVKTRVARQLVDRAMEFLIEKVGVLKR